MTDYEIRCTDVSGKHFIHRTHRLDSRNTRVLIQEVARPTFRSIEIWRDQECIYRRHLQDLIDARLQQLDA